MKLLLRENWNLKFILDFKKNLPLKDAIV